MVRVLPVELVRERKISDVLPEYPDIDRWEASGVLARNGKYFVVFDNMTSVARLAPNLDASKMNGLFGMTRARKGFEGITYNANAHRYYLLVESEPRDGSFQAEIVEYDDTFSHRKTRPLEFSFEGKNKGFEAVAHVRRNDVDYALALCEGNKCKKGAAGREPGGGRVQVFEKKKTRWAHTRSVNLPESVPFTDYSAMAIDEGHARVAVVSQENSMVWVGEFEETTWRWRTEGRLYEFPRTDGGEIQYGNVEGVSWISASEIVTVSDRRKRAQPDHFTGKDQSLHVFRLPE